MALSLNPDLEYDEPDNGRGYLSCILNVLNTLKNHVLYSANGSLVLRLYFPLSSISSELIQEQDVNSGQKKCQRSSNHNIRLGQICANNTCDVSASLHSSLFRLQPSSTIVVTGMP